MPVIIDVFSGVGGLSLGATQAGFTVAGAVELDERAASAHKRNFPGSAHIIEDARNLGGSEIVEACGLSRADVDGVIGGPPCQGFSMIGRRREGDERNTLFEQFARIVMEIRPRFFLAENVPGILLPQHADFVKSVMRKLSSKYTVSPPITVNASEIGAPTSRTRVFFFGVLSGQDFLEEVTFRTRAQRRLTVRQALRGLPGSIPNEWRSNPLGRHRLRELRRSRYERDVFCRVPAGLGDSERVAEQRAGVVYGHVATAHSPDLVKRYESLEPGQEDRKTRSVRLRPNGFCPTLRAGTDASRGAFQAVRPIHFKYPRVITPREAARLQTFPDWFQFDDTKWHSFRQIGNSVPPLLARHMLAHVRRRFG